MSDSSASVKACPKCGAALPSDATDGICPRCLMAEAMQPSQAGADAVPGITITMAKPAAAGAAMKSPGASRGESPELPLPGELTAMLPTGTYRVEDFLGQGGMGAVYKGAQVRLKRPVAIKIMRRDQGKDQDFEQRFEREAQAMAKLNHPNIVSVIDYGEAGPDYLYIVMELVDGADLMDVIRTGRMTQEMALTLLPQICDALQFAHDHGIVHRDIKPSNIMLTRDGRIKMADFGLAKRYDVESSFRTQTGTGMGTPDYAAPEQFDGSATVDHRADIYALGVMIYQMITGQLPRGVWKPPSQRAEIDPGWDEIVRHAMQSDPKDRYQQASEVKTDVSKITPKGVVDIPVRNPQPGGEAAETKDADRNVRATPTPRKSRAPLLFGLVTGAAVLAVGAFFAFKKPEQGGPLTPVSGISVPTTSKFASSPDAPKQTLDLIALVDVQRDRLKADGNAGTNQWTRSGGMLAFASVDKRGGKIAAPVALNGLRDYEVEVTVPAATAAPIILDLPISVTNQATVAFVPGQVVLVRDGNTSKEFGTWPKDAASPPWTLATRVKFEADGMNGTLSATINGASVGEWRGALGKLGKTTEPHPDFPGQLVPALYVSSGDRAHSSWTLRVFEGEAKVLRAPTIVPASSPAAPIQTFAGHRYQLIMDNVTWAEANTKAGAMGAHLAVVTSKEEDDWIRTTFVKPLQTERTNNLVIGGRLPSSKETWQWVTGDAFASEDWMKEPVLIKADNSASYPYGAAYECRNRGVIRWVGLPHTYRRQVVAFLVEWDDAGGALAATNPATSPEPWKRQFDQPEDHPAINATMLRDGWVVRKPGATKGGRVLPLKWTDGAIRAECRWSDDDNCGSVWLRFTDKQHYQLTRSATAVQLSFLNEHKALVVLKEHLVKEPMDGDTFTLELRAVGRTLTAKLDGQEVIRIDDDKLTTGGPGIHVYEKAGMRNIDFLNLNTPDVATISPSPSLPVSASKASRGDAGRSAASPANPIHTFAGHRYQFVPGGVKWDEAKAKAEGMGGHLACVTSKEEHAFFERTFQPILDAVPSHGIILGGYQAADVEPWRWVSGEAFKVTQWGRGEPDSRNDPLGRFPLCTILGLNPQGGFHWNDQSAHYTTKRAGFIVEWDDPEGAATPEPWVRKWDNPADHGPNNPTMLVDGWIVHRPGAPQLSRTFIEQWRDGAIRAEFRWTGGGAKNANIWLRTASPQKYALMRTKDAVELVFYTGRGEARPTLKDYPISEPKDGEVFTLELRAIGRTLTAKLDGREIIRVEDDKLTTGSPGIYVSDTGGMRNIEVLNLDKAGGATVAWVGDPGPPSTPAATSPGSPTPATATKDAPFINTLGMKFVPVPITGGPTDKQRVLFSVWETRVQDYEMFAKETKREWPKAEFDQGPTHPAVLVSWDDAMAFCTWLTDRERKDGKLSPNEAYRLPSDHEWSCAVGIGEREDATKPLRERAQMTRNTRAWDTNWPLQGGQWPPPPGVANLGGEEKTGVNDINDDRIPKGYRDDFVYTAPVGSFPANPLGLHDLAGNVSELVGDLSDTIGNRHVWRGGSFTNGDGTSLLASFRGADKETGSFRTGFRVVLAAAPGEGRATAPQPPSDGALGQSALPPAPAEAWEQKLDKPADHPLKHNTIIRDGWIVRVPDAADGMRILPLSWTDGAIRAECKWASTEAAGHNGNVWVRTLGANNHKYTLTRKKKSVELAYVSRSDKREVLKDYPIPEPKDGEIYSLELRAVGKTLTGKLDGREVIRVEDDRLTSGSPGIYVFDKGGMRNIDVLNLDKPTDPIHTFAGHRYQLISANVTWADAKAKAEALGGHLAVVTSKEEHEWIHKTFLNAFRTEKTRILIGGQRLSAEKPWQWVTGEPFAYEHWQGGDLEGKIAGAKKSTNFPFGAAYSLNTGGAFGWSFVPAPLSKQVAGFLVEWDDAGGATDKSDVPQASPATGANPAK